MASGLKSLSDYDFNAVPDASTYRFGIVVTDYHTDITFTLFEGCKAALLEHGVLPENIEVYHVPGTYELVYAARLMQEVQYPVVNAIICLGCVITGETRHDEYINQAVAEGLMELNLRQNDKVGDVACPVIFGVLTPQTHQQAKDRAGGKYGNKGVETAIAAIKMAALKQEVHRNSKDAQQKELKSQRTDENGKPLPF